MLFIRLETGSYISLDKIVKVDFQERHAYSKDITDAFIYFEAGFKSKIDGFRHPNDVARIKEVLYNLSGE